ncbi:RHS repeat-associated core domain-containing protein [Streptomyces parvulus]|uniref:RHS repeat domain-containing protein n=1 Tax=Streptomyces parvulus TaxID=146923 RepID=UPI001E5B898A|nr:RHS repeat-associated core domain-containing protein [Streptomyces parvulus]MCC9157079.1 RHS repeat-associated core domain-containing protein [Streptomyces parvulus]MCE7688643.1 RHS repeat-associated core domain-containing protein [Streptomyces parvulus]
MLVSAAVTVGGLTPVARAADGPDGLEPLWERQITKTETVTGLGAGAQRALVSTGKKRNKSQADRARAEQRAAWPRGGSGRIPVAAATGAAPAAEVGGLPVAVAATEKAASPAGGTVRVKVLGHTAATDAGIKGVLLSAEATGEAGRADISVGYGRFASAYGGGWSGRLGLVRLPECALTTPEKAECRTTTEVASANDVSARAVTGTVALSAAAPTVLALAATASGESASGSGNYEATPLSPASTWAAGGSSGAFTWSNPLQVPPAPGPSLDLSLNYDSGAVDGKTASTNNQATQIGEGFTSTADSYIERTYGSCDEDGQKDKFDLCWKFDNASLVLNGKSSELVKDDTTGTWRLKNDDASTVTLSTGADNGDDNGESWTVTTGDGTRYVFGLNKLDDADTQRTNSVWTVPVFGDDSGEPGYSQGSAFADRSVTQAWRWNLDYVEDLHDNAMSYWYTKETNSYAKNGADTATASYTRGGYLTKISYGQRADALFTGVTSAKVDFTYAERCTAADCEELKDSTAPNWPDVPFDSICAAGDDCPATGPSFFSRKMLTGITTSVWSAATSAFTAVDSWGLTQEFLDGGDIGDTTDQTLTLKSVKRTGKNGTAIDLDPVGFTYDMRPNRVDGDRDDILPLTRPRIRTVTSETGSITDVTLSDPECVRGTSMPAAEDQNTSSCYPQYWHVNGAEEASLDWFHKYRVTDVVTSDPTGHGATMESHYAYSTPAWHYNDSPFTPADERTWSIWRGYRTVTVTQGSGPNLSKKTSVYLQGMNGDRLLAADGTLDADTRRTATVPGKDFTGLDVPDQSDSEQFDGFLRQEITYNGSTPVSVTVSDPWSKRTATQHKSYADTEAYYIRTARTTGHTYLTATQSWRSTTSATTYDGYGMAVTAESTGDTAKTGDETCTRTWYARNDSLGINSLTSRTRTVGRACSVAEVDLSLPTSAAGAGDVVTDTSTVYDSAPATAWSATQTPTKGEPTWHGRASGYPAATTGGERAPAWATVSRITYDALGRPLTTTDAAGNATSLTYTPAATGPLTRTQTKDAKLYNTYAYIDPARGQTTKTFDPNNRITETAYDALGRTTSVWLPNRSRSGGQSASYLFGYSLSPTAPSWTSTGTLKADGETYSTSYTIYDSLLRTLQTQTPGATSGRILTDTRYDDRGLAYEAYADIFDTAAPSGTYAQTEYGEAPSLTKTGYDAAGRPTSTTFLVGGLQRWQTNTTYTGDSTATSAASGGSAARTITDALGRTVETRQYASTSPADSGYGGGVGAGFTRTQYTYTPADKQKTVTGPDGAVWTYTYDLYGREVAAADPDKGTTTTGYTALDKEAWVKSARGQAVISAYDVLGRVTDTWQAAAGADLTNATVLAAQKIDANKLTHFTYDTVVSGKGQAATSTRYVGGADGKAYTQTITEYDSRYNVTGSKLTLPANEQLVTSGAVASNTLAFTAHYKIDGTLEQTTEPAAGGLAAETVEYDYSDRGLPTTLTAGGKGIVLNTTYTDLGQVSTLRLGASEATGTDKVDIAYGYEDGTHRLLATQVHAQTHAYDALNLHYGYDDAGNVTKIADTTTLGGTGKADTQCFAYDGYQRLSEAWTPSTGNCTAAGRTTAGLGGAAPYWTSYTYDDAGQRATETTHGGDGPTTTTYCYKAGTIQPHTLLATTTGTCAGATAEYAYDADGNTTQRPDGSSNQQLDWNSEGKLSRLTEGPDGSPRATDYLYGADGSLLIRRDTSGSGETVLYLGATEVHLKGGKTWANRSYTHGGETVALCSNESGTAEVSYLAGDQHGTDTVAITADDQALTKRYFSPFGAERGGTTAQWPNDKAFLGKSTDDSTGLTHLGAREYDAGTGQFISVDPLLQTDIPQTLNGYSYAAQNPVTQADPSGLGLACGPKFGVACPTRPDGTPGNGRPNEAVKPVYACPSLINPQCPEYTGGTSSGGGRGGGGGTGSSGAGGFYMDKSSGSAQQQKATQVNNGCKDWGFLSSVCRSVGEVFYGAISNVPHAVEYAGWIWDEDCWGGGPGTPGCDYGAQFDQWVAEQGYDISSDEYLVPSAVAAIVGHNGLLKGRATRPYVNPKGNWTNDAYTVRRKQMEPHINGKTNTGKSQFLFHVEADKVTLDAAAYADANGLWKGNKARVYVENGPVGVVGRSGELTNWLRVTREGRMIHAWPVGPPSAG